MAIAEFYGTPEGVASLASMWTKNGEWLDPVPAVPGPYVKGTNPTLTEVQRWLENVSATLNLALGQANFIVPFDTVDAPGAYKALSQYVEQLVADLAHYKNSSGRFFSDKTVDRGISPMHTILKDMIAWIALNERGLLAAGLEQNEIVLPRNVPHFRVMGQFPRRSRNIP